MKRRFVHLWVCVGAVLVVAGCTTLDYSVTEAVTPLYTAIRPESAVTITEEHAVWGGRRRSPAIPDSDPSFSTTGPGAPTVYISDAAVLIAYFRVTPGEETVVTPHIVRFDVARTNRARSSVAVEGFSFTLTRAVDGPGDIDGSDLQPFHDEYTPPFGFVPTDVYLLDEVTAGTYRKVQAVAPEDSLFIHIETGLLRNLETHHWFVGRFESRDATLAAIADPTTAASVRLASAATPPEEEEPAVQRVGPIEVDVDAATGEVVTIPIDGGTYVGTIDDGRPDGQGRIEYDDGRTYEGGFLSGRFHGRAVLRHPDGREFEATFADGVPDGAAEFRFAGDAYEVGYKEGARLDDTFLASVIPNLERADELRADIADKVRQGLPEAAFAQDMEELTALQAQLDGQTGPERLLFEFQINDRFVQFRVNEEGIVVSRYEEIRIEDEQGNLLAVYRKGDRIAVTDSGLALRNQREEVERVREPQRDARFRTVVAGGGATFGSSFFAGGATAGIDFRYMNNGGSDLPGANGGSGRGWDFRGAGDASFDYQSYNSESITTVSIAGGGSIGRTRYTFEPANLQTLEQAGRGRTFGLQLLFEYDVVRPDPPEGLPAFFSRPWRVIPLPFFSVETYRYAPGTATLKSRTTEIQLALGGGIGIYVTTTLASF